jgi:hypothetical protein
MNFTVNIHADNAAFKPDPSPELARILHGIADRIEREGLSGFFETIHDVNGNDVGRFALKPPDYH